MLHLFCHGALSPARWATKASCAQAHAAGNWSLTGSVRGGRSNLLCLFRAGSKNREWGGDKMEMRWEGRREMHSWIQKLEKMGKLEKDKDTCLE